MRGFRSKRVRVLVATDVMSRGIDIQEINLVVNYDIPHDAEDYVHRVGRTARANTKGEAFTLITKFDTKKFKEILMLLHFVLQISKYINFPKRNVNTFCAPIFKSHKCNVFGNQANAKVWHSEIAIS